MKKFSKAAKAGQKVKLEYLDETQSLVSGAGGNISDEDEDNIDEEYADEMSKNWEKISSMKRYFYDVVVRTNMGVMKWWWMDGNIDSSLCRSKSGSSWHNTLKAQDYQVCITVIEARQLAGLNMDPVCCVQVKTTSSDWKIWFFK